MVTSQGAWSARSGWLLRLEAAEKEPVRRANLAWLGELARSGAIRLMGHDPDSPEAVTDSLALVATLEVSAIF